ncbi:MAG TPA: HEPN domain-containing protein [Archaeoglobaceae archaeon]|nr:HEPN domain-containing protein [Archaeoglobaceae archaeon]
MRKPGENFQFIEDWKKIARNDWQRVRRNLRDRDAIAAGFFLQQCLEKFLKAFLLAHGWKLKKNP